jgi:hypothetical protein
MAGRCKVDLWRNDNMVRTALALLSLLVLGACATEVAIRPATPQARIVIDGDTGSGDFCPPGQAKKGHC